MKELIGKTIESYSLKDDGETFELYVTTKEDKKPKKMVYTTYGDCCSSTWFESIDGDLFAGEVLMVEEISMDDANLKPHPRSEEDKLYGYKLLLGTGYGDNHIVDITYRNSSNGYYGGSCELTLDETN